VHELGIAIRVYEACREALRHQPPGRIEKVRLAIGELSAVEPDLIRFGWQAVTADTPDAGAELEVVWCPAVQRCEACGEDKRQRDAVWLPLCPDCGQLLQVAGGTELDVLQLTYLTESD